MQNRSWSLLRCLPNLSRSCFGSKPPDQYLARACRYLSPFSIRNISTSSIVLGINARTMTINSKLAADRLVRDMNHTELGRLKQALNHLDQELELEDTGATNRPTMKLLSLIAIANAVPFIGFGFLDNAIMIVAGEYIDCTIGYTLGISTMAAAAIGNMISDVAGIGLAGYVEEVACRLGVEEPPLTTEQLQMRTTKIACHIGRAIGIVIGCAIGMFPLIFVQDDMGQKVEGK